MRKLGLARIFRFKGIFGLCMCLVLVGIIILSAAERTAAATATGSLPVIKVFTGDPLTVPDGGHVVYMFEVYDGTKIQVIEAGEIIDEFNGPPLTTSKGKANGRTTYQILTGDSTKFKTVLSARNGNGKVEKTLEISVDTKRQPKPTSLIPPVSDNKTDKKNKWGPQTSAPVSSAPSATARASNWPPQFAKCSSGCYCLKPEDAASHGFTQKCLEQPCYYSPDKTQNWYCYGETVSQGWCCRDGKVTPATKAQCKEAGGAWHATEAEAIKACQQVVGWFCSGSKVYQGSQAQATQAGATWYATQAEATKACESPGWCCRNGQLTPATQYQCVQSLTAAGGAWYATQAEAAKACDQMCWCCTGGRYGQTTTDACAKMGGTCYATQAQASEHCQPLGGCCADGKVSQSTQTQCAQVGGKWYSSVTEAQRVCAPPPTCWCCTSGRYGQTTTDACAKMGGTCYATQAQASERCQPLGGCCADGKVSQSTQTQCAQVGGKWYSSVTEAQRACVPPPTYWCCSNGQVYQSTTLGRGCYTSQTEAQRACAPSPTYWCCSNGQVYQSKTPGTGCYATQAEATRACQKVTTPLLR